MKHSRKDFSSVFPIKPSQSSSASTKSWCEFHKPTTHSTANCKEHLTHIQELQDTTTASKANITDSSSDSQHVKNNSYIALSTHSTFSNTTIECKHWYLDSGSNINICTHCKHTELLLPVCQSGQDLEQDDRDAEAHVNGLKDDLMCVLVD